MRVHGTLFLSVGLLLGACSADTAGQATGAGIGDALPGSAGAMLGGTTAGAGQVGGAGAAGQAGGAGAAGQAGGVGGTSAGNSTDTGTGVACEAHVVTGTRATPDMLIVLDRSGSMNADGNDDNTDRWSGSRMALIDVTANYDDKVRFGLMTFPGSTGQDRNNNSECTPGMLNVPLGLNAGPTISSTLQSMNASGRTPTAATLQAALPVIAVAAATPDETILPKYVLLVTDGDPNCSGSGGGRGGNGRDDLARTQTIEAIQALTAAGVKTFVVGYQTAGTDFADQLDHMAAAGGTGETMHRSVASGADLNATFSEIAANVISCSYQLGMVVSDPSKVLVKIDGRPRNLNNAADGWRLETDKRTVTLTGAACDEVRAGAVFSVQVTCESVPLF